MRSVFADEQRYTVDFADVKTVMNNSGTALMGMGIGSGEKRAMVAIKQAISSPLLEVSIEGAKGVLFNIIGGPDLSMNEVDEAVSIIAKTVDPDADIIFGAVIDDKMIDQIKITMIATKFDEGKLKLFRFKKNYEQQKEVDVPVTLNDLKGGAPINEKSDELDEEEFLEEDSEFDIPAFLRKK